MSPKVAVEVLNIFTATNSPFTVLALKTLPSLPVDIVKSNLSMTPSDISL